MSRTMPLFRLTLFLVGWSVSLYADAQATYALQVTPLLRVSSGDILEVQTPVSSGQTPEEKRPIIYVKHLEPPRYPPLAHQTRVSGTIMIKLKIDADGTVLSAESSPGDKTVTGAGFELLRKDAEKYVKSWTFGGAGCASGAPFEHTVRFVYRLANEDVLPDHYVVMDLPDVVIMYASPSTINPSSATRNSKKGNN